MATYDEKEMLYDEIYSDIEAMVSRKTPIGEPRSEKEKQDSKKLYEFRQKILRMEPEEIDFDKALEYYNSIKAKYQKLPNAW